MEIIIKMDREEPVKVKTSSIYGELSPLPDWDPEKIRDEIQDLKLENDRLKQREEIMLHFIKSCACMYSCKECDITGERYLCHYLEFSDSAPTGTRMRKTAKDILSKLEALE